MQKRSWGQLTTKRSLQDVLRSLEKRPQPPIIPTVNPAIKSLNKSDL